MIHSTNPLAVDAGLFKQNPVEVKMRAHAEKNAFSDVLQTTMKKAATPVVDKKLMDACVEMESIFVAKMLREMRNTVHKGEFINGGFAEEIFEDMLYDQYALNLSKNSNLGMAHMLYNELSKK